MLRSVRLVLCALALLSLSAAAYAATPEPVVKVSGKGEMSITVVVPFPTLQPVRIEVQRCAPTCVPFEMGAFDWAQAIVTGFNSPNAPYYTVKPRLDNLNGAYGGELTEPGK